ncbi:MAG: DUF421 domain-containing protein, partial [Bifidobacterium tsurumiense]
IYSTSVTIVQYIIILLIWLGLVLLLKWAKSSSSVVKRIMDGEPVILIQRGDLDVEACRHAGLTAQEVAFKLRSQGVYSIREVKRAVLEQNGQLIIVKAGEENPKYPVITDGSIQTNVLEMVEHDEEWLTSRLKDMGYDNISDIFLAEYDHGNLTVVIY